jgi:type II secretory pathway pseudopilin PulG
MELVVVISLILVYTLPRFQAAMTANSAQELTRRLMATIRDIRQRAVMDQKTYSLNVDMGTGRIWTSSALMTGDQLDAAMAKGVQLPGSVKILDVQYPPAKTVASGIASIRCFQQGYCDSALIHLEDSQRRLTLRIEAFLPKVSIAEGYQPYQP